ncbi:toxin-antitoxin system YwqK family antitoxin [Reichenbachiella versicolor]|uniref:hypothetical protein n=1 Tax=Reichenbachiella versicolor TaxID=1821036 RepID=UPI001FEBAC79|nr:hypothetical protein [Reichenbachiella versicolor]
MKYNFRYVLAVSALLTYQQTFAQEEKKTEEEDILTTQYEVPLTVDLDGEEEKPIEIKKKKVKKKVFYGEKTRKGWTRSGSGNKVVWEQFYMLKTYKEPVPYVRDVYWFDYRKRKVVKSRKIDTKNAGILHGPYKKLLDDQVIEEGIFYYGVKHGRWMRWNKYDILQEKEKYYKGWPKESMIAYHNKEEKKIKEAIPVHFGEKEGYYFAFHPSGNMAAYGEYKFDNKVGTWREFYDIKNRRKREIVYPKDPFDDEFKPFVIREWDERGKLIYEVKKK